MQCLLQHALEHPGALYPCEHTWTITCTKTRRHPLTTEAVGDIDSDIHTAQLRRSGSWSLNSGPTNRTATIPLSSHLMPSLPTTTQSATNRANGPLLPVHEWQLITRTLALSPREAAVVRLTLEGMSERDVALHLGIAPRTVHAHLEHTYRKIDVHSRYELVIRLFREYVRIRACPE